MTIKWITTDQASLAQGIKCLIVGGSGHGKTMLATTAPDPFIISAEAGLLSLRKFSLKGAEISSIDEMGEIYSWLTSSKEARLFQTIYIDSLSEIAEKMLAKFLENVKDPRQAYAELYPKLETLIRFYRDIKGFHVVMTAKMEPNKDEMTGITKYGPMMPGNKFGPKLPYFFDEVFNLRLHPIWKNPDGSSVRYIQSQPDIQYEAKDRSGSLAVIEPPDLRVIFAKMLA